MQTPRLSPAAYRRVTMLALAALAFIVVTGAAVRLTGSGLGCPQWPACAEDRIVPPWEYHAMVEFVNRMVTGLVSVAVILAVLGSLVRTPRRRDLTVLSLGLVAGVIGQAVLGGLVVLFHLAPPLVMGHFVLSLVLLWNATLLHHRASLPDGAPRGEPLRPDLAPLARLLTVSAAVVLLLGTVVTGSGPHPGSSDGVLVERLPFALADVARLHGISVLLFLALTLHLVRALVRTRAPAALLRRAEVLLAVLVAQAAVGYAQYFLGVPAALVAVHIAGAVAVWVAVLRLGLALGAAAPAEARQRVPALT